MDLPSLSLMGWWLGVPVRFVIGTPLRSKMADSSGEPSEASKRQARREEYNPLPLTGKRAHLKPTPHRCNDRVEDVVQGIFKSKWRDNLYPQISLMFECLNSQPGQEPTAPYTHVTPTPPDDP